MSVDPIIAGRMEWSQLADFAANLPVQAGGARPHPVRTHLLQRLGDSQRKERSPVQARKAAGGFALITADNYEAVLRAFDATTNWSGLGQDQATAFGQFAPGVPKSALNQDQLDQIDQETLVRIVKVNPRKQDEHSVNARWSPEASSQILRAAWQEIVKLVEPEVLALIGLPDAIYIVGDNDDRMEGLPAYYEAKTKSIFMGVSHVSANQIRHEFGHYLEDQGPVEVWIGLASLLQGWSTGKALLAPRPTELLNRVTAYDIDAATRTSGNPERCIPEPWYCSSYYVDAGTELLAMSLQFSVVSNLDDLWDFYNPEFLMLSLQACRPKYMREHGHVLPALL